MAASPLKTAHLSPANNDNHIYYGQYVSMSDILFNKKLERTPTAYDLAEKIKTYSEEVIPIRRPAAVVYRERRHPAGGFS